MLSRNYMNIWYIFIFFIVKCEENNYLLPNIYDATVQMKSITMIHSSKHEAFHGIHRITAARFRVVLEKDIYYRQLEVFALRSWSGNIFKNNIQLKCGDHIFNATDDSFGFIISKPRILSQNNGVAHLLHFLNSAEWFPEETDGSTLPMLQGYIILKRSVMQHHSINYPFDILRDCKLHFIGHQFKKGHFRDDNQQLLGGSLSFRFTHYNPLVKQKDGIFFRALRHYEHFETLPNNTIDSIHEASFIQLDDDAADDDTNTYSYDKNDDDQNKNNKNQNKNNNVEDDNDDGIGLKQNTVGWQRFFDSAGALAPSFIEASSKIHHALKTGIRSSQIFAAIIDPICIQVPPIVANMIIELWTPPVIDLLYPILSDLLMAILKPDSTFGIYEYIEDIPIGGVPVTVPIDGVATQLLDKMNAGEIHVEYPVFLDLAHSVLFAPPPSITRIIKQKIGTNVANQVLEDDMRETVDLLDQSLSSSMRQEVNRTVSRGLIQSLTLALTRTVGRDEISFLCHTWSKSLTRIPHHQLTYLLTMTLTPQLGLILHHTLTRNPITDYQCYFCKWHNIYCWACAAALAQDYYKDVYTNYYAHYYASYYGQQYSKGLIPDFFVDNYINHNAWPPGRHISRTDIDVTGTKQKPSLMPGHEYRDGPSYGEVPENKNQQDVGGNGDALQDTGVDN